MLESLELLRICCLRNINKCFVSKLLFNGKLRISLQTVSREESASASTDYLLVRNL